MGAVISAILTPEGIAIAATLGLWVIGMIVNPEGMAKSATAWTNQHNSLEQRGARFNTEMRQRQQDHAMSLRMSR
jgi:hypothetical protein